MAVAKEILANLVYGDEPVALRCRADNKQLMDIDLDLINGVGMQTIWFNEPITLFAHKDIYATEKEIKTGKFVEDGSNDAEFVETVLKLLRYEEQELNHKGTKEVYCFYITGTANTIYEGVQPFEGYILAPCRVYASKSVKAYYAHIRKVSNPLIDVRVDYAKRHKMVEGFTPTMHYVEKSFGYGERDGHAGIIIRRND